MTTAVCAKAIGYAFDRAKQAGQAVARNGKQGGDLGFCKSAILNDIRKLDGLGYGI